MKQEELVKLIKEGIEKVLNENIGNLDDLILYAENNSDIYNTLYWVEQALLKKVKRGIVPDREHLIDCSTLRKIQQYAVKQYSKEVTPIYLTSEEKRQLREKFADDILEWIDWQTDNDKEE